MTDSPDVLLMQKIHAQWGTLVSTAVESTPIPEKFLAALIANESGGDPAANRFEPAVLTKLWAVLAGRLPNYGAITAADLRNFVCGFTATVTAPREIPANVFERLDELAHSWGLTQIMGYHVLEWLDIPGWYRSVDDLRAPAPKLRSAALLLTQFANRFTLDLSSDFSALLHCWNAGSPEAPTFDPAYVPNALRRMDLYGGRA